MTNQTDAEHGIDERWRELGIFFNILLVIGIFVCRAHWSEATRPRPDAEAGAVAIWFKQGQVSPGDVLDARVRIRGHDHLGVTTITVDGAGTTQTIKGPGKTWGKSIHTNGLFQDTTFDLPIRVAGVAPGNDLALTIRVEWVEAVTSFGRFTDTHRVRTLRYSLPVRSPPGAVLWNGFLIAIVVLLLVAISVGLKRLLRWMGHERRKAIGFGWVFVILLHAYVGYRLVGMVLLRSVAPPDSPLPLIAAIVCVVVPLLVLAGGDLRRRRSAGPTIAIEPIAALPAGGGGPYRTHASVPRGTLSIDDLCDELLGAGLTARRKRRQISVVDHTGPAALIDVPIGWPRRNPGVAVKTNNERLALVIARVLARRLGPLRCQLGGSVGAVDVRARDNIDQLEAEVWRRRCGDRRVVTQACA